MTINIRELKVIVEKVLEKCISNNGEMLNTEEDKFWYIDTPDGIDFSKVPDNLFVGSLVDDYINLEAIIKEGRNVDILDLERISNVIKFISFEIDRSPDKFLF
jgi:hypothetical protein